MALDCFSDGAGALWLVSEGAGALQLVVYMEGGQGRDMSELMQCETLCVMISGNHLMCAVAFRAACFGPDTVILGQFIIGCYDGREQSHCHLQHENVTCVHSEDAGVRGVLCKGSLVL